MSTRKPVPASHSRPVPRIDQIAAGVALGTVALTGCRNPFDGAEHAPEVQRASFDPGVGLASMFATSSLDTTADSHSTYPLITVAAFEATRFAHVAQTPAPTTAPKVTAPMWPSTAFIGGARASVGPGGSTRYIHRVRR